MRIAANLCKLLVAFVFAALFVPSLGWANTSTACPHEPAQNVPIMSGQTYFGRSCQLSTTGDVDSFTFKAASGDTWSVVLGLGPSPTTDICLQLFDPTDTLVAGPSCTAIGNFDSVDITQKLTVAGTYTIVVTDTSDTPVTYDLSSERLNPTPPDAIPLVLNKSGTYNVNPPTSQDAFTFQGRTTCTFEITVSLTPSPTQDICLQIYDPTGTSVAGPSCTAIGNFDSVSEDVTPAMNGEYMVIVSAAGNDSTGSYNIELAPLLGTGCTQPMPKCVLSDSLRYSASSSTLRMNFTVGTPSAATWDAWLVDLNDSAPVSISGFPRSLPTTEPARTVTATQAGLAPSGKVGVLSVLTTPTQGVTCSNMQTINTGKPQ